MDGFTVTVTLIIPVNSGVTNTIRIAVADVSDSSNGSNLLIAGNSIQTQVITIKDSTNLYPNGSKDLDVLTNDINGGGDSLTITHLNGQPVTVGVPILLNTIKTISFNANGTVNILDDVDVDDFNFTYTIYNGTNTDIGFVNVSSIPCFVAATLIATQQGQRSVETLLLGDLVMTKNCNLYAGLDNGPSQLRIILPRSTFAPTRLAPVMN